MLILYVLDFGSGLGFSGTTIGDGLAGAGAPLKDSAIGIPGGDAPPAPIPSCGGGVFGATNLF